MSSKLFYISFDRGGGDKFPCSTNFLKALALNLKQNERISSSEEKGALHTKVRSAIEASVLWVIVRFPNPPHGELTVNFGQPGTQKEIRDYLGIFPNMGRGGLPNSFKTFVNWPSIFFACQIHSEVLKHVLQRGGGDIWSISSPKVHLILFIPEKKTGVLGIWEVGEGGGPLFPKVNVKILTKTFWWKSKMFLGA